MASKCFDPLTLDQQRLAADNLRLVFYAVRKMRASVTHMGYDQCVSEGCLGLVVAARNYDPSKGFAFSTFATRCIISRIAHATRRWLRLPTERMGAACEETALPVAARLGRAPAEQCGGRRRKRPRPDVPASVVRQWRRRMRLPERRTGA